MPDGYQQVTRATTIDNGDPGDDMSTPLSNDIHTDTGAGHHLWIWSGVAT